MSQPPLALLGEPLCTTLSPPSGTVEVGGLCCVVHPVLEHAGPRGGTLYLQTHVPQHAPAPRQCLHLSCHPSPPWTGEAAVGTRAGGWEHIKSHSGIAG